MVLSIEPSSILRLPTLSDLATLKDAGSDTESSSSLTWSILDRGHRRAKTS
jgi:hypothetical protein